MKVIIKLVDIMNVHKGKIKIFTIALRGYILCNFLIALIKTALALNNN